MRNLLILLLFPVLGMTQQHPPTPYFRDIFVGVVPSLDVLNRVSVGYTAGATVRLEDAWTARFKTTLTKATYPNEKGELLYFPTLGMEVMFIPGDYVYGLFATSFTTNSWFLEQGIGINGAKRDVALFLRFGNSDKYQGLQLCLRIMELFTIKSNQR